MNIVELFEQDRIWITKDQIELELTEMDAHHRAATLAMLRRRAEYDLKMYLKVLQRMALTGNLHVSAQAGEVTQLTMSVTAEDWLENRPLVKELARLVRKDELDENTVEGEVVEPVGRAIESAEKGGTVAIRL